MFIEGDLAYKMATKDWMSVPVSRFEKVFDNRRTGERIFISKRNKKGYTLLIDGRKPRSFKNKSKALKSARIYMKSH